MESTYKFWTKSHLNFLIILIYSIFFAYFTPAFIARFAYLPLLFLAATTKRNVVWIAFLLVLLDQPGNLFAAGLRDAIGRAPLYTFPGGGIAFQELFFIVLILKSFKLQKPFVFYKKWLYLLYIAVMYAFIVSLINGLTMGSMLFGLRRLLPWVFVIVLPRYLSSKEEWVELISLLVPVVFLSLLDQISITVLARPLFSFVTSETAGRLSQSIRLAEQGIFAVRAMSGVVCSFIVLCGSLIFMNLPKLNRPYANFYIYFPAIAVLLQAVLSGTRGWSIAFVYLFIMAILTNRKPMVLGRLVFYVAIVGFVVFFAFRDSPQLANQANLAWARLMTVQDVAGGDLTAAGTADRWTVKAPFLLKRINESPIGFGFTEAAYQREDVHVGILNPLVIFGYVGYLFLLSFFFLCQIAMIKHYQHTGIDNPYRRAMMFCIHPLLSLFIIHLVTTQIFGLNISPNLNILVPVIIAMLNWVVNMSRTNNKVQL